MAFGKFICILADGVVCVLVVLAMHLHSSANYLEISV